jgi:hypothetical protein
VALPSPAGGPTGAEGSANRRGATLHLVSRERLRRQWAGEASIGRVGRFRAIGERHRGGPLFHDDSMAGPFDEARYTFDGSPPVHRDDIASVTLEPVPEGPTAPVFVDDPRSVEFVRDEFDLDELRSAIPDPLPATLDQVNCEFGGNPVITTMDGRTIAYGPASARRRSPLLWSRFLEIRRTVSAGQTAGRAEGKGPDHARVPLRALLTLRRRRLPKMRAA